MGETGLGLVGTHLCLTGLAPLTPAAAAHERRGHPLTDRPPPHLGADRDDHPDQFVSWDVWERHPVVVPGPRVPVTAAETGGVHLHDHAPRRWHRVVDRADIHRTTELLEDHRAHEAIVPLASTACLRHHFGR